MWRGFWCGCGIGGCMSFASREGLLGLEAARRYRDVPVPELGEGVSVRVRVMTGPERDRWDEVLSGRRGPDGRVNISGLRSLLVSFCASDESGVPLFSEDDVAALEKLDSLVLERLYRAAWSLNQLGIAEEEQILKN